jgi:hypothetical protein
VKAYPKYLEWLRYICAFMLYFYGVSKLTGHQLTVSDDIAKTPVGALSGYWLTWFYYSHSHVYKDILGLTQVAGASLLLFRRTTLIGALMMMPVMANILLINIFYSISAGAEVNAGFILACMFLLLWHQRRTLVSVLWTEQSAETTADRRLYWIVRAVILLAIGAQVLVGTLWAHRA